MKKIIVMVVFLFSIGELFAQRNQYQVSFGSGGGVTGIYITYTLDSRDRKIVKTQSNNKNTDPMSILKKKQVNQICKEIHTANIPAMKVNTPGNMSYFVNVTLDGHEYKTIWAAGQSSGNAALDSLYKNLMALVQKK